MVPVMEGYGSEPDWHRISAPRANVPEPLRTPVPGPAGMALRVRIREDRRRLPTILRKSLWASLALLGLAVMAVVLLAIVDPGTLGALVQMFGLSFAVGREAAMLYAYTQPSSPGPLWIFATAVVDDLVTLVLTLPLVWLGIDRLRGAFFLGGIVLSLEKTAVEKRSFLRRWGLLGLVAFVWFPGVGAGVFLAATIGMIAKIPLRRLILALAFGVIAVNAFWAIGLYYTSGLIPEEGFWSYIPLACVAALAVLAVVFGILQRRRRNLFPVVKVQVLSEQHAARLHEVGITDGIDLLYANRKILAAKLEMDPTVLCRLQSVAELSMLRSVSPQQAKCLADVGITSIRELAVAPPHLVAAALQELQPAQIVQRMPGEEDPLPTQCSRWTDEARIFLADSETYATGPRRRNRRDSCAAWTA